MVADPALAARAAALHADALVWDNHGCMPFEGVERWLPQLARYRAAGADVAMINIGDSDIPLETLVRMAAAIRAFVRDHGGDYVLATSVEAIEAARSQGKLAVGLDIEGVFALGDQLSLVQLFYDLGVRWTLMVYNRRNLAGCGVHDDVDEGLTPLGRAMVAEMDRVGMIKCCTHTGYRTARDVFDATDRPTIFSHSNPRAVHDHPRNIPDTLIDACAATRGVVCITGINIFLGTDDVRVDRLVEHVDHVVQRVGIAHAGIGLDYVFDQSEIEDFVASNSHIWPAGQGYEAGIRFLSPEALPSVTEELLRRGYADDDVRAVLGGNLMRVAREVWR